MIFLSVPAAHYQIGSTATEAADCVARWKGRLQSIGYTEAMFASWIEKEMPARQVKVAGFEMGRTLVSHADVKTYVESASASAPVPVPESLTVDPDPNLPVWGVSLEWARAFAKWLGQRDAKYLYRLPTETEWEAAARGPAGLQYAYGNEFNPAAANTCESLIGRSTRVDHYAAYPGPFGHLDLSGNLEEWVDTPYYVYPGGRAIKDDLYERLGPSYPILRGGSFQCGGDLSRGARRHGPFPDPRYRYTGFRLVRVPK